MAAKSGHDSIVFGQFLCRFPEPAEPSQRGFRLRPLNIAVEAIAHHGSPGIDPWRSCLPSAPGTHKLEGRAGPGRADVLGAETDQKLEGLGAKVKPSITDHREMETKPRKKRNPTDPYGSFCLLDKPNIPGQ